VLGEVLLVQTSNIRTEGEEIANVQENYSSGFAVVGKLPQIFAGVFSSPATIASAREMPCYY